MIRFLGNIEAKTDTKGRVFIPAGFRKQLQAASEERLVLRKDVFQDCLILYPESVWFKTQNQLRQRLNKWNAKHQQIFRQFVSDAEIMIPDGNGRILLPKRYLQMAGIQGEVRFIACLCFFLSQVFLSQNILQRFAEFFRVHKGLFSLFFRPDFDGVVHADKSVE